MNSDDRSPAGAGTKVPELIRTRLGGTSLARGAVLDVAVRHGRVVHARPSQMLFRAGDRVAGLHIVLEGKVRVTRMSGNRSVGVHTESVGGILGEIALFSGGTYPATATAVEPTVLCLIPTTNVVAALRDHPGFAAELLERIATRARAVIGRLDQMANLTVLQRLGAYLADRQARSATTAISLGMTQHALAEELGTVKEIVVRELRRLRELRLIAPVGGGRYRIVDRDGLRRLAHAARRLPATHSG